MTADVEPDAFTVGGTLAFGRYGGPYLAIKAGNRNDHCIGLDSASFAVEGQDVTLKDASGTVVALDRLDRGKIIGEGSSWECQFSFSFADVPTSPFYSLELGPIQEKYTADELRRGIRLTLGY